MKIIYILFTLFFSALASATPLNKVVVFGDSLSDNGNLYEYMKRELPMSPPYYKGRFTNGPVWIELLVNQYYPKDGQTHLLDYAFGGAGVSEVDDDPDDVLFTLNREIDSYFLSHHDKADDTSLYVVWMGSNNYLAVPEDVEKTVSFVTSGIKNELQRLVDKGAKHIMVVTVPDLGRTPAAKDFDSVALLTELSTRHNTVLKEVVTELEKHNDPSVHWYYFDVNDIIEELLNFPERNGLTNIVDTCYEEMVSTPSESSILKMVSSVKSRRSVDACTGYLFFDPVHPSEIAHVMMADRTRKMLDDAGVTFE